MTPLQSNIEEFMIEAGQMVRSYPAELTEEEAILRVKLVLEEAFELAEALGVKLYFSKTCPSDGYPKLDINLVYLDYRGPQNLVAAADAIADLNYVVNGTACALGIDMEPIDEEVHNSNMSKLIDGTFRADGKYMKGPSYRPPNIKGIIESQKGI